MRPSGYLLPKHGLDPMAIINEVARGFNLTRSDILGDSCRRHICVARACAMAVVREATTLSFPAIGDIFGRHHRTVMYHVEKVMGDPELSEAVGLVVDELVPHGRVFVVASDDEEDVG